jgi:hypothetical protein
MAALAPSPTAPASASPAPATAAPESRDARGVRWAWILGAAAVSLAFTVQQLRDPDVWWHLAVGNLIRAHGIPSHEPFTFLGAPNPWVGQQWGYEVLLSLMMQVGTWLAMVVMGLVGTAAFVVAVRTLPRSVRVPGSFLGMGLLLSCLVAASVLGVRGQVVTVLGSAITLFILLRWREGSTRAVWGLPPLLLVWANLHAGFVNGIALCAVVAASVAVWRLVQPGAVPAARVRVLLAATGVAVLATLVNPAGVHIYPYIASTFTNPTLTQGIVEWMSPNFHDWWLRLFEFEAVLMVVLWALSRRPDPVDVVLGIGTIAMTLQAQRNLPIFAVVAAPQVARYGWEAWSKWVGASRRRPRPAVTAAPAFVLAGVILVAVAAGNIAPEASSSAAARSQATRFPEAAATYVAAHYPNRRMYSTYEWGGYLAWRFPTQRVVYIYGESAVFGSARLEQYLDIHLIRSDWPDVLAENGMALAVVPAESQETTAFLEAGWTVDCHDVDSNAVVMHAPADTTAPPSQAEPPDPTSAPTC